MSEPITAQQIAERIKEKLGVTWNSRSGDGFCAGEPATVVRGIATACTPTLDVLRRAAAGGKNMIISREGPWWNRQLQDVAGDPAARAKREIIEANKLVVWRLRDNWQARPADGQLRGLALALGWDPYHIVEGAGGGEPYARLHAFFRLPQTTLLALVRDVQSRLKIQGVRVIGAPETPVRKVALVHGMILVPDLRKILADPEVDAVVAGEPVEWEASPYFLDVVASGRKKGLIVLGHTASEDPGGSEMAAWLKSFINEVPVESLAAGEPFVTLKGGRS